MDSVDWPTPLIGGVGLALLALVVYPELLPRGFYLVLFLPVLLFAGVAYVASAVGVVVATRNGAEIWSRVGAVTVAVVTVLLLAGIRGFATLAELPARDVLAQPVLAPFSLLPVVPFAGWALGTDDVVRGVGLFGGYYLVVGLVVTVFQGLFVAVVALLVFTVAATPLLVYGWVCGVQ